MKTLDTSASEDVQQQTSVKNQLFLSFILK